MINMKFKIFTLLSCALFGVFFITTSASAVTLGVSPPVISAPRVLKGGTAQYTVNVSMPTILNKDTYLAVEFKGDYGHYLTGPDTLIIPAGKNNVSYTFTIDPKEAAVGEYSARVLFYEKQAPEAESTGTGEGVGATVSVITGVNVVVNFGVSGEQFLEYKLIGIDMFDTEVNAPLFMEYMISNTGNVQWRPDSMELTFQDVDDETKTATMTVPGTEMELSNPGGVQSIKIRREHDLLVGKYTAAAKFFYQGEVVASLTTQIFNIYPEGTLKQSGDLVEIGANKTEFDPGEKIKFEASFHNSGNLLLTVLMITEIYTEDGTLVDLIRGSETEVDVADSVTLSEILELSEPGVYTIDAYVEYGVKKTDTKSMTITILAPEKEGLLQSVNSSMIMLIVLAIIIIIITLIFKKRKDRNNKDDKKIDPVSAPAASTPAIPVQTPSAAAEKLAEVSTKPVEQTPATAVPPEPGTPPLVQPEKPENPLKIEENKKELE